MDIRYSTEKICINRFDQEIYIAIDGYAVNGDSSFPAVSVYVNGDLRSFRLSRRERPEIISKYKLKPSALMCGFHIVISQKAEELKEITVLFENESGSEKWTADARMIAAHTFDTPLVYYVEHNVYNAADEMITVSGWAVSLDGQKISLSVTDDSGSSIQNEHRFFYRRDMSDLYFSGDEKGRYGFNISFHGSKKGKYDLHFKTEKTEEVFRVFSEGIEQEDQGLTGRIRSLVSTNNFHKLQSHIKTYGVGGTVQAVRRRIFGRNEYHEWFRKHRIGSAELEAQKNHSFAYSPVISLIVPVFNPPQEYFREMVESVKAQSYNRWQLCLADGSDPDSPIRQMIREYAQEDPRIRYVFLDRNFGISGNTNKALELAQGEYIGLFDHDDLLEPDILYEIVSALQETKHDVIYTDEDKFNSKTKQYEIPDLKPDFDSTLLRSENYITHFFVTKTENLKETGGFHSEYDGAQDLDMILRCTEKAQSVYHIPKILYHWRMHAASTAEDPASKLYCYQAGEKAVNDHLKRTGLKGHAQYMEEPLWGTYKVTYDTDEAPSVSVVLMNYRDSDDAKRILSYLDQENTYRNYEVILCDSIKTDLAVATAGCRTVLVSDPVKVSDINTVIPQCRGKYILLLNDVLTDDPEAVKTLLGYCMQKGTAAAGGKTVSAAGEVVSSFSIAGIGDFCTDAFAKMAKNAAGNINRNVVSCECTAVMPNCVMIRKKDFSFPNRAEQEMSLQNGFYDLCFRLRQNGEKIVFVPYSVWTANHDKKADSSGLSETLRLKRKWENILPETDPYYNPNYDKDAGPFTIR